MADKKIADLNEATTISDTDIVIVEDNANTKKMTWANLKTAIIGAFSSILGNRTYTEQNVVTNGESITDSINELDKGVIVESGSNANGRYVKWADGTMICSNEISLSVSGWSWNVSGSLYSITFQLPDFPVAFLARPIVEPSINTISHVVAFLGSVGGQPTNTKPANITILATTNAIPTYAFITYIAIGRWKA